ncbi:MAG TPA: Fe(3+) ABC transporter substrate-binding protein, partial [Alphaproteobacteria bacterium]
MRRALCLASLLAVAAAVPAMAAEVNLYSARQDQLIRPALDLFTKETGIAVKVLTANEAQLLQRLKTEGAASPADLLITTDAAHL